MKTYQYKNCNKKHNNEKYCCNSCRYFDKEKTIPVVYGLKHEPNKIVSTVRGVLKQAKTVADYHKMCEVSWDRVRNEENPYK